MSSIFRVTALAASGIFATACAKSAALPSRPPAAPAPSSDAAVKKVSVELQAQLGELEAHFDKLWRAREELLRALEGRPAPAKPPREPEKQGDALSRCRDEAREAIKSELAQIERELTAREWELSPRTVRLRRNQERLRQLEAELAR